MRVWDISVQKLCRKHLLAQHHEIHTIFTVIVDKRKGYSKHPEVIRWSSNVPALIVAHDITVNEMKYRGYRHHTPLSHLAAVVPQTLFVNSIEEQVNILRDKRCECKI